MTLSSLIESHNSGVSTRLAQSEDYAERMLLETNPPTPFRLFVASRAEAEPSDRSNIPYSQKLRGAGSMAM